MQPSNVDGGLTPAMVALITSAGLDPDERAWTPVRLYATGRSLRSGDSLHTDDCVVLRHHNLDDLYCVGVTIATAHRYNLHPLCTREAFQGSPDVPLAQALLVVAGVIDRVQHLVDCDQPAADTRARVKADVTSGAFTEAVTLVDGTTDRVSALLDQFHVLDVTWATATTAQLLAPLLAEVCPFPRRSVAHLGLPRVVASLVATQSWTRWTSAINHEVSFHRARQGVHDAVARAVLTLPATGHPVVTPPAAAIDRCVDAWEAALRDECQDAADQGDILVAIFWDPDRPLGRTGVSQLVNAFSATVNHRTATGIMRCPVAAVDWLLAEEATAEETTSSVVRLEDVPDSGSEPLAVCECFVNLWDRRPNTPLANAHEALAVARRLAASY